MAARWTTSHWIAWSLISILATAIALYAFNGVIGGIADRLPAMAYHLPDRAFFALTHFAVGGLVLLIGPPQFLPGIRRRIPVLHRWTGRVYVLGCLAAGIAGLVLAVNTSSGPVARAGFSLLALTWLATTTMAWVRARQRNFANHRAWMFRSYSLTLAAVTLRIYLPVSMAGFGLSFPDAYPVIAFACWIPNLAVAEYLVRRR